MRKCFTRSRVCFLSGCNGVLQISNRKWGKYSSECCDKLLTAGEEAVISDAGHLTPCQTHYTCQSCHPESLTTPASSLNRTLTHQHSAHLHCKKIPTYIFLKCLTLKLTKIPVCQCPINLIRHDHIWELYPLLSSSLCPEPSLLFIPAVCKISAPSWEQCSVRSLKGRRMRLKCRLLSRGRKL